MMKVLIADFDLFLKVGGGQTFYRSLIEKNPNVDFYYLITSESTNNKRPSNAHPIQYKEEYRLSNLPFDTDSFTKLLYSTFVKATNIAISVSKQHFDVIDVPDYDQICPLLKPSLRYYNVDFNKIALSMHGLISTTSKLNWNTDRKVNDAYEKIEKIQFDTVDVRYAISKSYIEEWKRYSKFSPVLYDLLRVITLPTPVLALNDSETSLNFVGRTEKRKGPDIFIEIVSWLPKSSYNSANIIGPISIDIKGGGSSYYIYQLIKNRDINIKLLPSMSQAKLTDLYSTKAVTILPSRYDTLNLVAIESLFRGCPTAIGNGAGVCQFLTDRFPKVPFVQIDVNDYYPAIPAIQNILENYHEYRKKLVDAIFDSKPQLSGQTIEEIYNTAQTNDKSLVPQLDKWYANLQKNYDTFTQKQSSNGTGSFFKRVSRKLSSIREGFDNIKENIKQAFSSNTFSTRMTMLNHVNDASFLINNYKKLFQKNGSSLNYKITSLQNIGSKFQINRVRIWRELAKLECMNGNNLISAAYYLRIMRAFGKDKFNDLDKVISLLKANGFQNEADTAEAMYRQHPNKIEKCLNLLEKARQNHIMQKQDYEFIDDRRGKSAYKASIIVSLYNADSKLVLFLQGLKQQTMLNTGFAEVILVDSGSPRNEYTLFKNFMSSNNLHAVYARTHNRETIQNAWNRGIALSRSPYITFLGVDETIVPNCLEILVNELDKDPNLDWVLGNSLVTNVDKNGLWINDIMMYDRRDYIQDLAYLETCYLSWVGSLYRKSIHDRFGLYDSSFRAAGDTEFKNRILPFIKTKAIPVTLGTFRNYPDDRTTQSPVAEIEDIRAWYLHRTLAGIKYAFSKKDPQDVGNLLYKSLRYRKSYCKHFSTDIEYAYNLSIYLHDVLPHSDALRYEEGISKILNAYRSIDYIQNPSLWNLTTTLPKAKFIAEKIEQKHRQINNGKIQPLYAVFNDNRHEQHSNIWR